MGRRLTYASFFSGVGGFENAYDAAGFERVFSCEIDPFCRKVFKARYGNEPEGKDITSLRADDIPDADIWVGGFPCQSVSVAGQRKGLREKSRSGLVWRWLELASICRPGWILAENVPGLFSSFGGSDFGLLLAEMARIWPAVGWRVLDAEYLGVPQRRNRVFIVGGPRKEGVLQILAESEGSGRNPAKSGQTGSGTPQSPEGGVRGSGKIAGCLTNMSSDGSDDNDGRNGHLIVNQAISAKWSKGYSGPAGDEHHNLVVSAPCTAGSNPNSNAAGRRREDDENLVVDQSKAVANTCRSHNRDRSNSVNVVFDLTQVTSPQDRSNPQAGNPCHTLAASQAPPLLIQKTTHALTAEGHDASEDGTGRGIPVLPDPVKAGSVRRLTCCEVERLQGFPCGWTCLCDTNPLCPERRVPEWIDAKTFTLGGCGHSACGCACPDSPRYRVMGNAVAVPVVRWLADRYALVMKKERTSQ